MWAQSVTHPATPKIADSQIDSSTNVAYLRSLGSAAWAGFSIKWGIPSDSFSCLSATCEFIVVIHGESVVLNLLSGPGLVFLLTIIATILITVVARVHSRKLGDERLATQQLNKWFIGLSAGATANSGFVVTAGVGLGYLYGLQWLLLPIAWLIGDLVFWRLFPARLNEYGTRIGARTLTDVVTGQGKSSTSKMTIIVVGLLVLLSLSGYTAAQWLAGQKFIAGAFGLEPVLSLVLFAAVIVIYTAIGGFRGSIYADSFMAIVRIIGTVVALWAVVHIASQSPVEFSKNIQTAGPDFLNIFGMGSPLVIIGFMFGFACASLGFGLGQPQVTNRYLAGRNGQETQSAWWIYIFFVQFTWVAMTVFGLILRGIMPNLDDPEAGLSIFFVNYFGPILAGVIVADIFSTIAATSNSLLVAMAQTIRHDLSGFIHRRLEKLPFFVFSSILGIATMVFSLTVKGTVLDLAVSSISIMGAGLAPAIMVKVLGWRNTETSILAAILMGLIAAVLWKMSGYAGFVNEAAPGIFIGLITNFVVATVVDSTWFRAGNQKEDAAP